MKRLRKGVSMLLLFLLLVGSMAGCQTDGETEFRKMEDFEQAKIGVLTGSSFDLLAKEHYPEAERSYFTNPTDLIINLEQKKIDGILMDMGFFAPLNWEHEGLSYVEMDMPAANYAVAFPKSEESETLMTRMNEFIADQTRNGGLDRLQEKWFGGSEPDGSLDLSALTGENGTLHIVTTVESKPFDYLKDGAFCGFDADFIYSFAMEYGYALDIDMVSFDALLPGLSAERYDLAISSITVTEERKESVLFSDIYCSVPVVMAISDPHGAAVPTLADIEEATIGIITGSTWDLVIQRMFPEAERKYFTSSADLVLALEQGKIDTFLTDKTMYVGMRWENSAISYIDEPIQNISNALILAKEGYDERLLGQINDFVAVCRENGTLTALADKWFGDTEPEEHPDYTKLTGENGTLRIAVSDSMKPTAYQRGSLYTGYELDFLTLFAEAYGYQLDVKGMTLESLIPAVATGKSDIGACGITITPERAESVTFADSHFETYGVAVIRGASVPTGNESFQTPVDQDAPGVGEDRFLDKIGESFEKTFIRENRWKLLLEGIGVTLLISLCAAVGGTVVGMGLYMLKRSNTKPISAVAGGFARIYSRLIAGTPVVVILMILFYVIFGRVKDMSGILVAILGFTLTFGAFVFDHMTVAVGSVDPGQTEAAYALGYTKHKAFFRIVFPQAMKVFLPSYCGHAVELIKATAVVGYIAVNDLTKMGDIIRSNTYEAFFPLIATAVIYFLLTWIGSSLLGIVRVRFEPKRRSNDAILKGIRTN